MANKFDAQEYANKIVEALATKLDKLNYRWDENGAVINYLDITIYKIKVPSTGASWDELSVGNFLKSELSQTPALSTILEEADRRRIAKLDKILDDLNGSN